MPSRYRWRRLRKLRFLLSRLHRTSGPAAAAVWDTNDFPSTDRLDPGEVTEGVPMDGQEFAEAHTYPPSAPQLDHQNRHQRRFEPHRNCPVTRSSTPVAFQL